MRARSFFSSTWSGSIADAPSRQPEAAIAERRGEVGRSRGALRHFRAARRSGVDDGRAVRLAAADAVLEVLQRIVREVPAGPGVTGFLMCGLATFASDISRGLPLRKAFGRVRRRRAPRRVGEARPRRREPRRRRALVAQHAKRHAIGRARPLRLARLHHLRRLARDGARCFRGHMYVEGARVERAWAARGGGRSPGWSARIAPRLEPASAQKKKESGHLLGHASRVELFVASSAAPAANHHRRGAARSFHEHTTPAQNVHRQRHARIQPSPHGHERSAWAFASVSAGAACPAAAAGPHAAAAADHRRRPRLWALSSAPDPWFDHNCNDE